MIKEALQYLISLSAPTIHEVGELEYHDRSLTLLKPPEFSDIQVRNLTSICDLITERFEGLDPKEVFLIVKSPTLVILIDKKSNAWGQRKDYASADCTQDLPKFPFGQFMDTENFIIALQSMFVPGTGDVEYISKTASSLSSENSVKAEDSGIAQRATVRKGVVLQSEETIKARVTLTPYRTFLEADQPPSEFIFRLKHREGAPPACALFEADGGKWKLDAIQNVAAWLARNTTDVTVIA